MNELHLECNDRVKRYDEAISKLKTHINPTLKP